MSSYGSTPSPPPRRRRPAGSSSSTYGDDRRAVRLVDPALGASRRLPRLPGPVRHRSARLPAGRRRPPSTARRRPPTPVATCARAGLRAAGPGGRHLQPVGPRRPRPEPGKRALNLRLTAETGQPVGTLMAFVRDTPCRPASPAPGVGLLRRRLADSCQAVVVRPEQALTDDSTGRARSREDLTAPGLRRSPGRRGRRRGRPRGPGPHRGARPRPAGRAGSTRAPACSARSAAACAASRRSARGTSPRPCR